VADVDVFVRLKESDNGRLEVRGVRLEGPVGTEALRAIPLGRIEAAANAQLGGWGDDPTVSEDLVRRPTRPPVRTGESWDQEAAVPVPADAVVGQRPHRGRPDAFYAELADEYRALVAVTGRPAVEIAQRRDVPISTAHRWIKEARRRRLLPPGRPGKAG
jgi:hypothetical protein